MEEAYEMGLTTREFWRMTPLEFDRRRVAYRRKQEANILPLRRLEAAIWNVQIAKTKDGKQVPQEDFYPLEIDKVPRAKVRRKKLKIHYSPEESQTIHDYFNS